MRVDQTEESERPARHKATVEMARQSRLKWAGAGISLVDVDRGEAREPPGGARVEFWRAPPGGRQRSLQGETPRGARLAVRGSEEVRSNVPSMGTEKLEPGLSLLLGVSLRAWELLCWRSGLGLDVMRSVEHPWQLCVL